MSSFPFVYHEGISARFLNKKKNGSAKNIRVLFEKHFLDEKDTAILLHLQKYVYLNAFLLRTLLGRQLNECTPSFCNTRLKKLEKMGFVVRFQFFYTDDKGSEHATPFVYCLSVAGRKVFPIKNDLSFEKNIMDIDCVQRRLSFNQFHIMFEGQYEQALLYSSYVFDNTYDGLYKLNTNNKPFIFYVISIRSTTGWKQKFIERLRNFDNFASMTGVSYSALLVICENEYQALIAERSRRGDSSLNKLDIYYVCDYSAVAEGALLQHVINVKPENNYSSYDIINIQVDGSVKVNVDNISLAETL